MDFGNYYENFKHIISAQCFGIYLQHRHRIEVSPPAKTIYTIALAYTIAFISPIIIYASLFRSV